MVVLDRRGTVPGHHPRYYRPPTLIGAGVGSRERRQDTVDLVPRHGTTIAGDPAWSGVVAVSESVSVVVARRLVERGQVVVGVVGFGDAEVGVKGQCVAPVVAGLVELAGDVVGVGEAVVGTGQLVAVADLGPG